jgi:hypothetical protein
MTRPLLAVLAAPTRVPAGGVGDPDAVASDQRAVGQHAFDSDKRAQMSKTRGLPAGKLARWVR